MSNRIALTEIAALNAEHHVDIDVSPEGNVWGIYAYSNGPTDAPNAFHVHVSFPIAAGGLTDPVEIEAAARAVGALRLTLLWHATKRRRKEAP